MKNILLIAFFVFTAGLSVFAQEPAQPSETPQPTANQDTRAALLRQIGLSPDQVRQIRRMNMDRKPLMEAAQQRLRAANKSLDEAIYSDSPDESQIQERVKEAQMAQADVIRLRSMNELALRRILTPDQLTRFREMRQQFESARENIQNKRKLDRVLKNQDRQRNVNTFRDPAKQPVKRKDLQRPNQ